MPESSGVAPNPPQGTLENPQMQLDAYLATLDASLLETIPLSKSTSQQDEILNVTEFLYGNNALVAALALLDSSTFAAAIPSIRKISSPPTCGRTRSVHVVHGSSSSSRSSSSSKGIEEESYYLCFTQANNGVDYCSCRSFLEKATKAKSNSVTLCKHLLALKLAPYLKVDFVETHLATHQEFCKVIMERTLSASKIAPKGNIGGI